MSIDVVIERDNTLWLAIGQYPVGYDRNSHKHIVRYSMGLDEQAIRALFFDDDLLYMGTTKGLKLFHVNTGEVESVNHLPASVQKTESTNNVKSFYFDDKLGLLVGTVRGLYSFDLTKKSPKKTLIQDLNIWGMINNQSEVYIATQRGLFSLDKSSKMLTHLIKYSDINPLITNNSIKHIFLDNSGLIWLSSQIQGVFTFNPSVRNFSSFSRLSKLKLSNSVVVDFIESRKGEYWIGTKNGLNFIDSNTGTIASKFVSADENATFGSHIIMGLFPIENNKMWVWNGSGLSLFDLQTKSQVASSLSTKTNKEFTQLYPYGLEKVSDSQFVFISPKGHFLLDVKHNKITSLPLLNNNYKPEDSATFLPSFVNENNTLLATTGGLIDYNIAENTAQTIFKIEGFHIHDYKYVSSWLKTKDGHIWLVVNGLGLVELDRDYNVIQEINKAQGLTDVRVYGILDDEDGNLWISSQSGLFKYEIESKKFSHYSAQQGLVSNEVYQKTHRLKNGKLAFSSAAGMVMFNAADFEPKNTQTMPVKLLNIEITSRDTTYSLSELSGKAFKLEHDDYGIKFNYSNFNYALQKSVTYQVSLSGGGNVLYDDLSKNSIEFNRLNPGKYTFSVRARSPISGELGKAASFVFYVKYSLWFSPIAYFFYVFFSLSIFVVFYMRRVKQQSVVQTAHDDMLLANQRAELALEASNSGIWLYNHTTGELYQNRLNELGYEVSSTLHISELFAYIHPEDAQELRPLWHLFIAGKTEQWDVLFRVKDSKGEWVWYRDMGKACLSNGPTDNQMFTGTYSNVTDTKSNEDQAQLYGQALQKMNEWLLILDKDLNPIASNPAFNKRFLQGDEVLSQMMANKVLNDDKLNNYLVDIRELKVNQKLIIEDVVTVPAGFDIPALISISAIGDLEIDSYVIIISDLSAQKKVEDELKYLASFDSLTHLANRVLIRDRIEQLIASSVDDPIALLFIDLDRFKQVNDIYGHLVGDKLLIDVAQRMNEVIDDKHCVGRQSGDEFIVTLEGVKEPDVASRYADQLIERLAQPYYIENKTIHISCSIGVAFYPHDSDSCEELIQNADIAMLHAKQRGRNCYRFFTDAMNVQIRQRVLLENEFVWAVKENALINYYQPIVDVQLQKIRGVELLLRWFNHDKMVSPGEFIPLAETIGKIVEITEQALEKALIELGSWLCDDRYLSINLSALHISQPQMVERLLAILAKENVATRHLKLEITEGVLIDDTQNAKRQLTKLKEAGFKLFLDDFGTGYSSLTYINQFPIDVIKIDQCFISKITTDIKSRAIVQTIANLADNINSYCVVEGVEELEQVQIVQQLGCRYMQGYYFARPMPAIELLSDDTSSSIAMKLDSVRYNNMNIID